MALPVKVVDINAATLPDFKSVGLIGWQKKTVGTGQADDDGTFYALGDTKEYVGQSFSGLGLVLKPQALAVFNLQRVGNPTFTIRCKVYRDSGDAPDFNQLITSSYPRLASSITTGKTGTSPNFEAFHLLLPFTPTSNSEKIWFVLQVSAAGNSSNYIKVFADDRGSAQTQHTGSKTFADSWVGDANVTFALANYYFTDEHHVFGADKTNNVYTNYKSAAGNIASWAELYDPASLSATSNNKSFFIQNDHRLLNEAFGVAVGSLNVISFTKLRGTDVTSLAMNGLSGLALNTSVTGVLAIGGGVRPSQTEAVFIYQGATETVMGSARRRLKLHYYTSGAWNGPYDVKGSANTPNSTLPGTADHYDLRWAGVDPNGDCHILFSDSSTNTIQYRKFTTANAFTTINTLNGAVALATANYPIGTPTFYFQDPDWFIAVPYVDSASSTVKVARCKTTITETSTNWTVTEAVAANAETSGSIPCILVADNGQGGKLFLFRVKPTTKGLAFTHDSGSNTWVPEQDFRGATQTVGGLAGLAAGSSVDLVYLEEGTTPDELRYDSL